MKKTHLVTFQLGIEIIRNCQNVFDIHVPELLSSRHKSYSVYYLYFGTELIALYKNASPVFNILSAIF